MTTNHHHHSLDGDVWDQEFSCSLKFPVYCELLEYTKKKNIVTIQKVKHSKQRKAAN